MTPMPARLITTSKPAVAVFDQADDGILKPKFFSMKLSLPLKLETLLVS